VNFEVLGKETSIEGEKQVYFFEWLKYGHGIVGIIAGVFWFWMLYDCIRNEPEAGTWVWVMIILNVPGALLYLLARKLPHMNIRTPAFVKRWTRRDELAAAQYDAHHIGNVFHFVRLGDALRETRDYAKASDAYAKALDKDMGDVTALWGGAITDMQLKRHADARDKLALLMKKEANYKFGEASLVYGRALYALKDYEPARDHLQEHLKRHNNAEARVLPAKILINEGKKDEAKQQLQTVVEDARGLPAFHYRRNRAWIKRAKWLLRRL